MNINSKSPEYLSVRFWTDLTKEERESGDWVQIDNGFAELSTEAREKAMQKEIETLNKSLHGVKK